MAIVYTLLARASDGLALVAEESVEGVGSGGASSELREEAGRVGASLADHGEGARLLVDSGDRRYFFSCLRLRGVAFVAVATRGYPKEAAGAFLEDVAQDFWAYVQTQLPVAEGVGSGEMMEGRARHRGGGGGGGGGGDVVFPEVEWSRMLESVSAPHKWVRFDRMIERRRKALVDPTSASGAARVKAHVDEIRGYMSENIEALIERGEAMGDLRARSERLAEDAKKLKLSAHQLNACTKLQPYAIPAGISLLVILGLVLRFFVFV